jgi:hypothetical protein
MLYDDEPRGSAHSMTDQPDVNSKPPALANHLVHVVVRLVDGDRVVAGSYADTAEARRSAEELLGRFAETGTAWPLVGDRYLRPEAVVSIDLVEEEHRRWGGSADRAKSMDAGSPAG